MNLDLTPIKKYQDRLSDLKRAIGSFKSKDAEAKKKIKGYEDKIKQVEDEYANDKDVQDTLEIQTAAHGIVIQELATDETYIRPFFKKVLVGDVDSLDFTNDETVKMSMQVILFFFQNVIMTK